MVRFGVLVRFSLSEIVLHAGRSWRYANQYQYNHVPCPLCTRFVPGKLQTRTKHTYSVYWNSLFDRVTRRIWLILFIGIKYAV